MSERGLHEVNGRVPVLERCDGSVAVETWMDGKKPWSPTMTAVDVVTEDGRRCDRGCTLTETQHTDGCETAAEPSLPGRGAEW